ncbi:MAG TPA: hypothetical protein VGA73_11770, partial [Candidatus Binatia bacterium]
MRLKLLLVIGFLALMTSGCDLGPVGTPPPLTRPQARALANCQHTIKVSSSAYLSTKFAKMGDCADKILALQLAFENGLMTSAQFETALDLVRKACLKNFEAIGRASTTMTDLIFTNCSPVEDIIFNPSYDPLQFIALSSTPTFPSGPKLLGDIESVGDIVRYACLGGEIWMDTALFYNMPRFSRLLETADLNMEAIPLDERCFNGFTP